MLRGGSNLGIKIAIAFGSVLACQSVLSAQGAGPELRVYGAPSFSADGRYLAVIVERLRPTVDWRIRILDSLSWNEINLTPRAIPNNRDCTEFAWSPAGQEFTYALHNEEVQSLQRRIGSLSPIAVKVIPQETSSIFDPVAKWSRNGRFLAFGDGSTNQMYRYGLAGDEMRSVTPERPFRVYAFDWADDGESVWIAAGDADFGTELKNDGIIRIYFEGRKAITLCNLPRITRIKASPDRKWLACELAQEVMHAGIRCSLALVEVSSGKIREIGLVDSDTEPVWRSDSKYLAYSDGPEIRLFDPVQGSTYASHWIGSSRSQPFWNPADNSLWVNPYKGSEIRKWTGKEWALVYVVRP